MRSSLTNKSRVFFWLTITVQKLFWLTVVQVWAVVGIKWAAMWIPLVTNLILVIQAFKKIHSQSLSSSSKVLTAHTWTSSNLWWSLWLSSNLDYSMIVWFYWKAEALCKNKFSLILKETSPKLGCEYRKCQLLGWQRLNYKLIIWKICTHKLVLKLPWFEFKLVPPQFEEILKKVWSPEVSWGCIFEEKRQFTQDERSSGWFCMTPWRSLIWCAYSSGVIITTREVLNFLSEVLFVLNCHSLPHFTTFLVKT